MLHGNGRGKIATKALTLLVLSASAGRGFMLQAQRTYADGRPATTRRLDATESRRIIRHGEGPARSDYLGAREAIAFKSGDEYYLHYDGAGPRGWLACLATSRDLDHWDLKGPVLDFGPPGSDDAGTATSPWTIFDGHTWWMFYVGSRTASAPPNRIPVMPYYTLLAKSDQPGGPWVKQTSNVPFHTKPGTYYSDTASPGPILKQGKQYLMFFSAATVTNQASTPVKRTISIARTKNLGGPWTVDPQPILPLDQQLENAALYFEPTNKLWFLFANHIGLDQQGEYTESIWVYWSKSLTKWNPENRAVALDRTNCPWCGRAIGMPSVVQVGNRLALFYDSQTPAAASVDPGGNMARDIGIAWYNLPLQPPR
jgi:predicted GH43/DUF377 family glycosyl hydrolase